MTTATRTLADMHGEDIIDSRDIIARIDELTAYTEEVNDADPPTDNTPDEDERAEMRAELATLRALADDASGYAADWQYGEALIRDSYFEEYARELADDIGATNDAHGWPLSYIDWAAAADALKMDYTAVDFDGIEYWIR